MPRTRRDEAPIAVSEPEIEGRYVELDDFTVGYESFPVDVDPSPFFKGLPDDRCQCPHWGVVLSGEVTVRYADAEEILRAGDAYYLHPGHLTQLAAGTEVVEFSPTAALQATMAVVGANMQAGVSA
ncbi:MAG TPA: AraC family ligand binding domain-containing protein [Jatrophihabitantaceae bacterium]|nr:AraC family ligand binding domain-containing protein [Jatrophihabitantaceae bacterium]